MHRRPSRRLDIPDRSSDCHENQELKQCGLNLCPINPLRTAIFILRITLCCTHSPSWKFEYLIAYYLLRERTP